MDFMDLIFWETLTSTNILYKIIEKPQFIQKEIHEKKNSPIQKSKILQ